MKKTALAALVSVASHFPPLLKTKLTIVLGNSAEVLKQILAKSDEIPQSLLNQAPYASSSSPPSRRSRSALGEPMAAA